MLKAGSGDSISEWSEPQTGKVAGKVQAVRPLAGLKLADDSSHGIAFVPSDSVKVSSQRATQAPLESCRIVACDEAPKILSVSLGDDGRSQAALSDNLSHGFCSLRGKNFDFFLPKEGYPHVSICRKGRTRVYLYIKKGFKKLLSLMTSCRSYPKKVRRELQIKQILTLPTTFAIILGG